MTGLDIPAIIVRNATAVQCYAQVRAHNAVTTTILALAASAEDVPVLLGEIERLTAELDAEKSHCAQIGEWNSELKAERDELALVVIKHEADLRDHAAALDACRRSRVEIRTERDEARAALAEEQAVHAKTFDNFEAHSEACLEERTRQLDRYARLEAEHARLRKAHTELVADSTAGIREAGAEIRDLEAALADALQVIADLRGGS